MTTCSIRAQRNLSSQGFTRVRDDHETVALARAASFQPAATLGLLLLGVGLTAGGLLNTSGAAAWFGALAALGWLAVALPAANVFDRLWNAVLRPLLGGPELTAPPTPRRFSQSIAATFLTTIALLFGLQAIAAAYVVAAIMAVAASLAAFADVCIGSLVYGLLFRKQPAA